MVFRIRLVMIVLAMIAGTQSIVSARELEAVSPGGLDRVAEIEGRCPTFIWEAVPGAAFFELVAYRLPDGLAPEDLTDEVLAEAGEALKAQVPGGAGGWTPDLADGLERGATYVWFVRPFFERDDGELEGGSWSSGRFFTVSSPPLAADATEVAEVLRRFLAAGGSLDDLISEGDAPRNRRSEEALPPAGAVHRGLADGSKSVSTAKTAIKGSQPDATGETYGVVGLSNSANGAGLAAGNTNGGADLVLDGLLDGQPDTVFTQAGIDRASTSELWFSLINSGTGVLSLNVEGQIVGSGSGLTNLNGSSITSGSVSADRLQNGDYMITSAGTSGKFWKSDGDGAGHWAADNDTTYTAGAGLVLDGTEMSAVIPGAAWGLHSATTIDSVGSVGYYSSITIGSDGLPVISYHDDTNGDLKVAHCSNVPCTSANINTIDSVGLVGHYSSIAIGADGLPVISYRDYTNGDLKVAHCSNVLCTSATIATIDSAGDVGTDTSITLGADGLPVISYHDKTNGDLKVAYCSEVTCSSATLTTIDSAGDVGSDTSITVGADGLPIISYLDTTNWDLRVAHCSNATCSSATITTLDSSGTVGRYTSITVGADGLPVISYRDETNDDLKVGHCSDVSCTSATITTLDSPGNVGSHTSIAVGSDGLPVIAYYDTTNLNLKVAHCSNLLCTAASITTPDSGGDVGILSSITISADGLPVISYRDESNADLKVAHCSNVFCVPYARRR